MPDEEQHLSAGGLEDTSGLVTIEGARWYVAHTRSRNEKIFAEELGRLQVPHYLPLAQRITRSPSTKRISRSLIPVFPGYVFFQASEEQRYAALRTNRIASVLDVPDQAQIVRELTQIQVLLATQQDFSVLPKLKKGDWGRIVSGSLMGLEGVVTQLSGQFRLTMNVTILGQSVSIEVERHTVERIDPPAHIGF